MIPAKNSGAVEPYHTMLLAAWGVAETGANPFLAKMRGDQSKDMEIISTEISIEEALHVSLSWGN